MTTEALKSKLSGAKTALVVDHAFIASLLCSLRVTWDDKLEPPTMVTDGKMLTVCPAYVASLSAQEMRWALANITMRLVFACFMRSRVGARDLVKWDIACDVVINALLLGLIDPRNPSVRLDKTVGGEYRDNRSTVGEMRRGAIYDWDLYKEGGKTIEGVYAKLPDIPPDMADRRQGVVIFEGSPAEQDEMESHLHVQIAQARDIAKAAGNLSDNMARYVDVELTPRIRWKDALRNFCTQRVADETSWARPSRRGLAQGLIRPGKDGQGMGDIVVAMDLSGSTTDEERQEYIAELRAIKTDCQPANVHILYFTGDITGYDHFGRDDDLVLNPRGRGGTRFSPIFRFCREHDIDPACAVILTDLQCSDFGPIPDYPVLWISTSAPGPAPFGQVVMLREQSM